MNQINDEIISIKISKQEIPENHLYTVAGYIRTEILLFIPQSIVDLILFFYAKPMVLYLKFENNIKYILCCPINDNWYSVTKKITHRFGLDEGMMLRLNYNFQQINQSNWDNHQWNEHEIHEIHEYTLDDILIDTVTNYKHREERTDFVEAQLRHLFHLNEDFVDGNGIVMDTSIMAANLVSFLHDDDDDDMNNNDLEAIEITTDVNVLQQEIDALQIKIYSLENELKVKDDKNKELNIRMNELEYKNDNLMKEIEFLQNSKTSLALQSTKCMDELRSILLKYQKYMK